MKEYPYQIFCIYTQQIQGSVQSANQCVKSGRNFGYDVRLYPSVYWKDVLKCLKEHQIKSKYQPSRKSVLTDNTAPATRIANGLTHYELYKYCLKENKPLVILEHDSEIIAELPTHCPSEHVIQISSHTNRQASRQMWEECKRAQRMRLFEPGRKILWSKASGIVIHPLSGMNGTSGYIIGPKAAQKLVDVIEKDGVAFADRIRTEYIGESNLFLQKPQSVFAYHDRIKSHNHL